MSISVSTLSSTCLLYTSKVEAPVKAEEHKKEEKPVEAVASTEVVSEEKDAPKAVSYTHLLLKSGWKEKITFW